MTRRRFFSGLLSCVFGFAQILGASVGAGEQAVYGTESGGLPGEPFFYFLDTSGELSIGDILERPGRADFSPMTTSLPSFGFTGDAVWLRLEPGAEADAERTLLFSLRTARLREVDWYLVRGREVLKYRAEGIDRPPAETLRGRYPAFLAEIPAGEAYTLYVRVRSDSSIWLPLRWAPLSEMLEMDMRWNFLEQAFLGFGFAMVMISILVSLAHPSGGFVRLAGITFFFLGYHLLFHGYLDWWIPGLPTWFHRHLLLVCAGGSSLFMLLFTKNYFMDKAIGRFSRWLLTYSPPVCLVLVLILTVMPFRPAADLILLLNLLVYGFGLLLSGRMFYRRRTPSDFCFMLAWLFTALTIAAFGLQIHLPVSGPLHPLNITRMVIPMMFLFFLVANLQRQRSLLDEKEKLLEARQAETRAHLEALRYQLNPHFLFNALNSVEALSRSAPWKISEVVLKLATFLRLRLKPSSEGLLPLREEITICRAYLDIEKIRFEERLQLVWQIDEACEEFRVPEMILQPLIENAVKHGLRQNETQYLMVSAEQKKNLLVLSVRNNGKLLDISTKQNSLTPLGNANLQKRLFYQYGNKGRFTLNQQEGWVTATVMIPLTKEMDAEDSSNHN